ncbi:MAG TPA: hypothetical protein VHF91_08505, partial [Acidimicrobiales bacterium]|nr:hypothetical protein [Acidimicrobiales bacterium]
MPRAVRGVVVVALVVGVRLLGQVDTPGLAASPRPDHPDAELTPLIGDMALSTPEESIALAVPVSESHPVALPTNPDRWFSPGGKNGGTEGLARFLAAVAVHENKPLYVSDTWGRTGGNGLSDHHVSRTDSWAVDVAVRGIQAPTPATDLAATRIATALGEPNWTGGDLTKTVKGYR